MNREAFQSPSIHQLLMGGSTGGGGSCLWSLDNMRPITHPLLAPSSSPSTSSTSTTATSSSSSSSAVLPQYLQPSSHLLQAVIPMTPNWHDNQELPESWSQLLLGGLVEEDRCSFTPFQTKKMENWQDQFLYPTASECVVDLKQELSDKGYIFSQPSEEILAPRSSWSQIVPNSSPRSCVTTSFNSSMLDFSNSKAETRHRQLDHSSQECNSTPAGSPYKKTRVQASSAQSTIKMRKEKLGDRITALHQLVSPFGKLLNDNCMKRRGASDQDGSDHEPMKDLRSRGLCLVPVSFTLHVGSDNGADYWAPTFGGGFR